MKTLLTRRSAFGRRWSCTIISSHSWMRYTVTILITVLLLRRLLRTILLMTHQKNHQNPNSIVADYAEQHWNNSRLLNITNFAWIINNENLCAVQNNHKTTINIHKNGDHSLKAKYLMPIIIHSARGNFMERMTIRKTWGSITTFKSWDIRIIFLLGEEQAHKNGKLLLTTDDENEKIKEEFLKHGDLVVGNFVDNYQNLTYKHMMGYKWVLNFCSNATMVTKLDDDVFLNILQWIDMLTAHVELINAGIKVVPQIYCEFWKDPRPDRNPMSKYFISYEDWPYKLYPGYCSGLGYAIETDLLRKLYLVSLSPETKFLWIDDVYVTGHLVYHAKKKKYRNEHILYGNISDVFTIYHHSYQKFCESHVTTGNSTQFNKKVVTLIDKKGNHFTASMECLWNKTLVDYFSKTSKIKTIFVSA